MELQKENTLGNRDLTHLHPWNSLWTDRSHPRRFFEFPLLNRVNNQSNGDVKGKLTSGSLAGLEL
jgi:hypothetical protein